MTSVGVPRNSQEPILAQIHWASAGTDRSLQAWLEAPTEFAVEEELIAAPLEANEALVGALRVYEDLERVAIGREAEEISKRHVRINRFGERIILLL